VNKRTSEGYLDGALYHNNPVRIAFHESKLIWPDVHDHHPDILLSIGTGHNGEETGGRMEHCDGAEQREQAHSDIVVIPSARERHLGLGKWFKNTELVQNLTVMVNRVDSILNSEQIWLNFRNDTSPSRDGSEIGHYHRINPKLGYPPPKLDEKGDLEFLQQTVRGKLKTDQGYRKKISSVVHRLVASSFYFELLSRSEERDGHYICRGMI